MEFLFHFLYFVFSEPSMSSAIHTAFSMNLKHGCLFHSIFFRHLRSTAYCIHSDNEVTSCVRLNVFMLKDKDCGQGGRGLTWAVAVADVNR
jgi:hypothetical protein